MGNQMSCCLNGPTDTRVKRYEVDGGHHEYVNYAIMNREDTNASALQHIQDREADDEIETDPSTHPTAKPTFMERSKSELKLKENRRSYYVLDSNAGNTNGGSFANMPGSPVKRCNSCSTIYVDDSTISQPNLKSTIKCISSAIYYHIINRKHKANERLMEIFEERLHPIMKEPLSYDYLSRDPEQRQIYRFIRTLFHAAQLTAECAIITLVYIERLLTYAEIDLCASNWRRVVLGAIMLSSKVWDDQAVWNVDYCQILRDCSVDDMNDLERQFLECVQFNINVPSSVFAKYYFDLRTLASADQMHSTPVPLDKDRAKKLEALSRACEDKLWDLQKNTRRKWRSDERLPKSPLFTSVVIS